MMYDNPRPCVVNGSRALFHGWAEVEKPNIENGKQVGEWKNTVAVIEYQNGDVQPVNIACVRFLDGAEIFSRYDWSGVSEDYSTGRPKQVENGPTF